MISRRFVAFATAYQNDPKFISNIIVRALLAKDHRQQSQGLMQTTILPSTDLNNPLLERQPKRSPSPLPAFIQDDYPEAADCANPPRKKPFFT